MMVAKYDPFFISGVPKPKGSWVPVRNKKDPAKPIKFRHASNKTAAWCDSARSQVALTWGGPELDGPVAVEILFLIPRPKTVVRQYPTGRFEGDLDKHARSLLDAMTGTVYGDDSQVVDLACEKRYTDGQPGAWVTVSTDL